MKANVDEAFHQSGSAYSSQQSSNHENDIDNNNFAKNYVNESQLEEIDFNYGLHHFEPDYEIELQSCDEKEERLSNIQPPINELQPKTLFNVDEDVSDSSDSENSVSVHDGFPTVKEIYKINKVRHVT